MLKNSYPQLPNNQHWKQMRNKFKIVKGQMNSRQKIIIFCQFLMGLCLTTNAISQSHFSFESNWPYEQQVISGQKSNAISTAMIDQIPVTFSNPANNAFLTHRRIFFSINHSNLDFGFTDRNSNIKTDIDWNNAAGPGYCSLAFPFSFLNKKWIVAASYNGSLSHGLDEQRIQNEKSIFSTTIGKSGQPFSLSTALSFKVHANIGVGIGYTKRFGKTEWRYEGYGNSSCDYSSQGINIGMNSKLGNFRFASVIYLPHQVLKCEDNITEWWTSYSDETIRTFNGALKTGVAFSPLSQLTIGLNYSIQPGIEDKSNSGDWQQTEKHNKTSNISGGFEYKFHFGTFTLPLYAGYKVYQNSKDNSPAQIAGFMRIEETKNSFQEIFGGANIQFHNISFYFDAQFSQNSFTLNEQILPPWS